MRIFIAGGGETAYQLARRFSASQQDVVVIEEDPEVASRFQSLDVQLLDGNPAHVDILRRAGVREGDAFVACSGSDELNILASLAAKKVGGARTFCFVSKEEYYRGLTDRRDDELLLDIDHLLWPQYMLAEEIARIVVVPRAIDVEIFAGGAIWLAEYRLSEGSRLLGRPLRQLDLPRGVLAVANVRDGRLYIPSGDSVLGAGDKIVFMGQRQLLQRFVRGYIVEGGREVRDVTIIGGGNAGLTLAKLLEREERVRVKLIERSQKRCEQVSAQLHDTLVLQGDGTDLELLQAEQIDASNVLVAVTSDDQTNLLTSLLARQMKIPKIVTRVNKRANVRLFEQVGIDVPLNPRVTAINTLLNLMQRTEIRVLATVEQGKGEVLEMQVPEAYEARRLRDLPRFEGMIVGAIMRGRKTWVPHGDDRIQAGDRLLIFCTQQGEEALRAELQRGTG